MSKPILSLLIVTFFIVLGCSFVAAEDESFDEHDGNQESTLDNKEARKRGITLVIGACDQRGYFQHGERKFVCYEVFVDEQLPQVVDGDK